MPETVQVEPETTKKKSDSLDGAVEVAHEDTEDPLSPLQETGAEKRGRGRPRKITPTVPAKLQPAPVVEEGSGDEDAPGKAERVEEPAQVAVRSRGGRKDAAPASSQRLAFLRRRG